ncbi:MAG: hypothetical protein IJW44_01655, partial [Clostridia bacterium]|nr:hypothetical protein [Clostridia bacterium]
LIFSFDVEDYVNENAAEGILRVARMLRQNGIRGSFQTVGMMADALAEWGRQDILDKLGRYHEIGLHSHRHSMHPTINEYTDLADFDAALNACIEDEQKAIGKLQDRFGISDPMPSACPPGMSTSYVAHYAYAKLGFPIYTGDSLFDARRNRPVWGCNIANLEYNYSFEKFLFTATEDSMKQFLEEQVIPRDIYVLYHHPQRAYLCQYYDLENFLGENKPKEAWVKTRVHTDEEIATFYKNLELLIQLIQNDPRIHVTTYGELAKTLNGARTLTRSMLPDIKAQLDGYWFPVTTPDSFCLADVLHACAAFLRGEDTYPCGEVFGFLDTPYTAAKPVTLTALELREIAERIRSDRFLPEYYLVGDKKIGPSDFLRAALAVLVDGAEQYTVLPDGAWQIDLDQFPFLRDLSYKGTWCHCESFEDRYLSHRFRLQSWTFRLPKGTERKIFE